MVGPRSERKLRSILTKVGVGLGVLAVVAMLGAVGWLIIKVTQADSQATATTSDTASSQTADSNGLSLGDASKASGAGTSNDIALQGVNGSSGSTSQGQSSAQSAQAPQSIPTPGAAPTSSDPKPVRSATLKDGLKIDEYVFGTGDKATKVGNTLQMHYVGYLTNGQVFDTSLKGAKTPFAFKLGAGQVIPGWDEGLQDMHVGAVRRLTIPAALAYGAKGSPPAIPPNSTLIFDVQLMAIQ